MKRILSIALLFVMLFAMTVQPAFAEGVSADYEADYVFGGAGKADKTDATTMKAYTDTTSGNWCWYGQKWTMDGANAKKRISSKKPETNRLVMQNSNIGDWFALDIKAQPAGIYEVDFTYVVYDNSNAGAGDIYFIEKPADSASVEAALSASSLIGSVDCYATKNLNGEALGTNIEPRSKDFENVVFKEGKEYILVVRTTRARDIQIKSMHVKKIGDVGKLESVSASAERTTIPVGDEVLISLTGTDSNGSALAENNFDAVSYSTSDSGVATVSERGIIKGVASGTATITATATLGGVTKTSTIDVVVCDTEKYLFSAVKDTWTVKQGTSSYKTVENIPYDQTTTENWEWYSKNTASDNFKIFALATDARLQVAAMNADEWFAFKIKSPGTGKYIANLEYVAYGGSAGKSDIYIIPLCAENKIESSLVAKYRAGNVNFADSSIASGATTTKVKELAEFTFYENREYIVVFKLTASGSIRPNQLMLMEIPGAEVEPEVETVSSRVSFVQTTNVKGFDGTEIVSVERGDSVELTAHKQDIDGYKFVGWKRGADTSNQNVWVDIAGDSYKVWTNTYLTAVYEPISEDGKKVVEFWNQNGAYLGKKNENDFADALAITPTLTGFDVFLGWFTDENVELTASSELKVGTTNAVAQYNASTISDVKHNGVLIDGADTYNASITLDKTSSDTTCWKRDGMIIAYGDTYKFNVWDATNITEGAEIIEDKVPVAILDFSEKHGAATQSAGAGAASEAKAQPEAEEKRTERRRRIAAEAAKQCGRAILPEVNPTVPFSTVLEEARNFDLVIFCYEGEGTLPLGRAISELDSAVREGKRPRVAIIVGSEGGFSEKEALAAKNAGLSLCGLGKRILRTETAATFVLCCAVCATELS